jgi:hypothetical protein
LICGLVTTDIAFDGVRLPLRAGMQASQLTMQNIRMEWGLAEAGCRGIFISFSAVYLITHLNEAAPS